MCSYMCLPGGAVCYCAWTAWLIAVCRQLTRICWEEHFVLTVLVSVPLKQRMVPEQVLCSVWEQKFQHLCVWWSHEAESRLVSSTLPLLCGNVMQGERVRVNERVSGWNKDTKPVKSALREKKVSNNGDFIMCDIALRCALLSEENQRLLLTHPDVNAQLSKLLASGVLEIQKETLALIMLYSENENGRRLLVRHQDLSR